MKIIILDEWPRRMQYENFINYTNPIFSVGTTIDVTNLVQYCEKNDMSFFSAFLYVVTRSINSVEEMRIRVVKDELVLFDKVHPGYVVLCENGELRTCLTEADDDYKTFYDKTRADITRTREQSKASYNEGITNDVYYISCLPWIKINSVINPYNFADKEQTSIPRIMWGKYYKNGDRYEIGFDIAVHHALADGVHIGKVIECMEELLSTLSFMEDGAQL